MGTYLTDDQIRRAKEELSLVYALPYASDLIGTAWEQILTDIKGGVRVDRRDNRPRPDLIVHHEGGQTNYSVKTERPRTTLIRSAASEFLGFSEDFIVARPKVDELFVEDEIVDSLSADELGGQVLQYYNERIVHQYRWDVIAFLLRLHHSDGSREFIYWEERPPAIYRPADYWWQESGKARGRDRNINGYPHAIEPGLRPLPRATFNWTSGGKQFYVLYQIPLEADIWRIDPAILSLEEVREALRRLLRAKKRSAGQPPAT